MFKKNTTQCILGLSYDNLIWSPKKTKVCGRTSPLLQLWDSFGFWHTSICSPQIIISHPKKNPEMIETVQPREKMPAGSNQATPSKKKGKHLQVSSNFLDFLDFSCYFVSRLVFGVLIYIGIRIIDKPPKANQKKKSTTKNTSQNAQKKWKNHLANQWLFGPWSPPPTPPFVLHYVVVLQGHAMPRRCDWIYWMNGMDRGMYKYENL